MEKEPKPKKKSNPLLRISLSEKSSSILDSWKSQLLANFPGIEISPAELANWAVERAGPELSKRGLAQLKDAFFDDLEIARFVLDELKKAKDAGTPKRMTEILQSLGLGKQTPLSPEKRREAVSSPDPNADASRTTTLPAPA